MTRWLLMVFALCGMGKVWADPMLELQSLGEGVYALVGELDNRSPDNLGNNATFGFVVTDAGVVLIDSGGSAKGAAVIQGLIAGVTDKPVKWVINTGGQDHRWLGNGHFKSKGATIIASATAVKDQKARVSYQLVALGNLLGADGVEGTEPVYADQTFDSSLELDLGGVNFHLVHIGPAHTPGDIMVWLPRRKVVFSGDMVYAERMLGVSDVSHSGKWMEAFDAMAALQPKVVVPGHGHPVGLEKARKDTYDYLAFLRTSVAKYMEAGGGIETVGQIDQSAFSYLRNYDTLKGRNAQQVYSELEWE